ncbi:unnamed protein product [Effrenium voratum]|nr:unnamed protein product [Effrenium voratum]
MIAPEITETKRFALEELSVESDSGWRDTDAAHIEELEALFLRGEYGFNVQGIPQVLKKGVSAVDGGMLLADGKAVIHVLKKLKPKVGNETPAWLTPRMQEVFEKGARCDVVRFQDETRETRVQWYAMSHLSESNKFRETTLKTIRDLCIAAYSRTKSWESVESDFLGKYGSQKKSTVKRWLTMSRHVEAEVVDLAHPGPSPWLCHGERVFRWRKEARAGIWPLRSGVGREAAVGWQERDRGDVQV